MERHHRAQHAGAEAGLLLPGRDLPVLRRLLGADAGLAARHDVHQGSAGNRPAHRRHRSRSSRRPLDRAVWTDRITKLDYADIQARSAADGRGAPDRAHAVRRQLCGLPRARRPRAARLPQSHDGVMAVGRHARQTIAETIRVGINSPHPKSRNSQMPAFGRDQVLPRADMDNVIAYLLQPPPSHRGASRRQRRGRKGRVHGQLRDLSWRRCQGKAGRRLAQPDRFVLASMAAIRSRSTRRSGAGARAICRAGKIACRRSTARSWRSTSST